MNGTGKSCWFSEGLYTLWLCTDFGYVLPKWHHFTHPQTINNAAPTTTPTTLTNYLRKPTPE
jgi:hypothetical protein